jgi:curli biogenesis system outer membrane secretion channel CsgG
MKKEPEMKAKLATLVIVLVILAWGSICALAQKPQSPKSKVTVAIMDFKLAKKIEPGLQATIRTSVLTEKLKTALAATRKFEILERQDVDMLADEVRFAHSKMGDPSHGPKNGKMVGADFMITGEISLIQANSGSRPIPSTDRYNQITSGTIIADIRIIDTQRASVVAAAKIEASSSRSIITTSSSPGTVDDLFMEDLQRQLVDKMANKVIETVFPIKVVQIDGGLVYLNRGEGGGLAVGDQVTAYELGKELIDPDTGENLGASERPVAVMEVTEILPKFTKAKVINGAGNIANGMIVRVNPPSDNAQ